MDRANVEGVNTATSASLRELASGQLQPAVQSGFDSVESSRELLDRPSQRVGVVRLCRGGVVRTGPDERPFAASAHDQAGGLESRKSLLDSGYGHAVLADDLRVSWQLAAWQVLASLDRATESIGQLEIGRACVVRIQLAHGGESTATRLAGLALHSTASSAIASMSADVAQHSLGGNQGAPVSARTPAEAYIATLGETMQVNGTRMLRVKAVAEMYDVSPATIYRAIEAGHLTALKLGSERALRIPETALEAYEASRRVSAPTADADARGAGEWDD